MSTNALLVDVITALNGTTIALHDVAISNTSPATDQILTATSSTAAEWQTGISALTTTTTPVDVSASAQPATNDLIIAYNSTNANWNTFGGTTKLPVRVATTTSGTLASDFENGDSVDDVVLSTGDRILIKDQTAQTTNGIYTVNATGAPTRATDLPATSNATNVNTFVQEGTANRQTGFVCTSNPAVVDTNNLVFEIFTNIPHGYSENNTITDIIDVSNDGTRYIRIPPGTFTLSSTMTIASNTTIEGSGTTLILDSTNSWQLDGVTDVTIRNISFQGTTSSNDINIINSSSRILFKDCFFSSSNAIDINIDSSSNSVIFKNCTFTATSRITVGSTASIVIIDSCRIVDTQITFNGNNIIITNCILSASTTSTVLVQTTNTNCIWNNNNMLFESHDFNIRGFNNIFNNNYFDTIDLTTGLPLIFPLLFKNNVFDDTNVDFSFLLASTSGSIFNANRFIGTSVANITTTLGSFLAEASIERNQFPDNVTAYTNDTNQLFSGVSIDSQTSVSTNPGTTLVDPLFSYLQVTTTGVGVNGLEIQNNALGPLANTGHWFAIERTAGSLGLNITSRLAIGLGPTITSLNSNGDIAYYEWTGQGARLRATNF